MEGLAGRTGSDRIGSGGLKADGEIEADRGDGRATPGDRPGLPECERALDRIRPGRAPLARRPPAPDDGRGPPQRAVRPVTAGAVSPGAHTRSYDARLASQGDRSFRPISRTPTSHSSD